MTCLRISLVSEHASPLATLGGNDAGGQNVHVAALATELGHQGHEVVVHTRRDDPALLDRVPLAPNVVVDHVDAGPPVPVAKDSLLAHMGAFADELQRRWWNEPPDLVHAHFWMSGLASLDAAHPLGIPVVQTFHALGVVKRRHQGARDTSPPQRLELERRIVRDINHVVATCADEVFELRRLGLNPERSSVVPCGVNVERFTPAGPAEPRRLGRRRIVCVGRLVERKGVDDVVRALADVPDTELVVVGGAERHRLAGDPDARRLRRRAEACGVADRVVLRGRMDQARLPALLRSADALVCVPWYEPFGIVPLEAMGCGLAVVASAVGGLADTVVDGVTGVHVPPREPAHLARALRHLLDDPQRARRLGEAGTARVRRRYRWTRISADTATVYRRVLTAADRTPTTGVAP